MSKNRNRKRTEKALTNKEYKVLFNIEHRTDCIICAKRVGSFRAVCSPVRWLVNWRAGYKNPRKSIATWQAREYRTWKYNRKTQWKQ